MQFQKAGATYKKKKSTDIVFIMGKKFGDFKIVVVLNLLNWQVYHFMINHVLVNRQLRRVF